MLTNCKLLWWGKIFNAYKKDKISPCDDVVTWYVICCAKCHFLPFLPFSSITMPPSWKMLEVSKTPENSTLWASLLVLPAYDTKRSHFLHYRTKIREWRIGIDGQNLIVARYALHNMIFLVNTIYYHSVNTIYSTIHIIPIDIIYNIT